MANVFHCDQTVFEKMWLVVEINYIKIYQLWKVPVKTIIMIITNAAMKV